MTSLGCSGYPTVGLMSGWSVPGAPEQTWGQAAKEDMGLDRTQQWLC